MKRTLALYDSSKSVRAMWAAVQTEFRCCGVDSYTDWSRTASMKGKNVPDSCCEKKSKGCGNGALSNPSKIYSVGCFPAMEARLVAMGKYIKWGALAFVLLQLAMLIIGCILKRTYRLDEMDEFRALIRPQGSQ